MRLVENWKATATPSSFNCSQEEKNGNECSSKTILSNKHAIRPIDTPLEFQDSKVRGWFEVHTKANGPGKRRSGE